MEHYEFASVTYCTNEPRGTISSDEDAEYVATQVEQLFRARLAQSEFAQHISILSVRSEIGCILTTITLAASIPALYKFVKDYPKFRPGLVLLLKDLNGVMVRLRGSKKQGSTYLMRDDIPQESELTEIAVKAETQQVTPKKRATTKVSKSSSSSKRAD